MDILEDIDYLINEDNRMDRKSVKYGAIIGGVEGAIKGIGGLAGAISGAKKGSNLAKILYSKDEENDSKRWVRSNMKRIRKDVNSKFKGSNPRYDGWGFDPKSKTIDVFFYADDGSMITVTYKNGKLVKFEKE